MAKSPTIIQLEAQKVRAKNRADAAHREQRRIDAQMRAVAREATHKRRLKWGTILDQLGLFKLDEDTLKEVLTTAYAMVQRHGGRMPRTTDESDPVMEKLHGVNGAVQGDGDGQRPPMTDDALEAFLDAHPNDVPSQRG